MNDRFKYRMWDVQNQKYEYFDLMKMDGLKSFSWFAEASAVDYDLQVKNEAGANWGLFLEQCTGLKDKNGKLIYEGDVVKIIDKSSRAEPFVGVVEYTNTASFEANCRGFYMHLHNPKTPENISMVEKMFCTSLREIEVIGNIQENPELLEGKDENN